MVRKNGIIKLNKMEDFLAVTAAGNVQLNALTVKNFNVSVGANMNLFIVNSKDGDSGIIILTINSTGGYVISMSAQFIFIGTQQINTDASSVNMVKWTNVGGTIYYSVDVSTGKMLRKSQRYVLSASGAKAGTTAGWVVNAGNNLSLATIPASQTNSTLILPVSIPLKVGNVITGFSVIGQIESAGNTATLSCDLRKHTAAAADVADASVSGLEANVSVTADTIISATNASKKGLAEIVGENETFYFLITSTTAASTDIALQGITITISEL
jgi:hypothetical protein